MSNTEYTPIEFEDIQIGDTVRRERDGIATELIVADKQVDYVQNAEGHTVYFFPEDKGFLIDRPKPPVVLPTEPTLGWLTTPSWPATLAEWSLDHDKRYVARKSSWRMSEAVTDFIPAVAVPKAVFDELLHAKWVPSDVERFFIAVDEANS